jgi:Domain of unknown function (DUF4349)
MRPFRDETELAAALRELRPEPWPEFTAKLDARAAARFPRDSRWRAALARLRARIASTPPRRMIAPAGALAVVAIVVATAVLATTGSEDRASRQSNLLSLTNRFDESPPPSATEETGPVERAAPSSSAAGGESAAGSAEIQIPGHPDSGPYASDAGRREIERSAELVLSTEPAEVRAAAAKVFDAVHAADGIVLSSSLRDGEAGVAGADFELLIPSGNLGDALASLSAIGEVRSRHESTQDITAPTVSVGERLQDATATVQSLLSELAGADTDAERVAAESQLRAERHRVAALRSRLSALKRRANLSRVSLRIETGSPSSSSEEGGAWGIGDGIDGAGRILAVAAGVTVIGLAILAPFALIALLAWLTRRAWIRRARRAALGRA